MEELRPETTLDRAIRWNINQLEEKMGSVRVYKENLEKIFSKEFQTEFCQINTDEENVTITLHLMELTKDGVLKLNEIADDYIIEPCSSVFFSVKIFQFKGAEE